MASKEADASNLVIDEVDVTVHGTAPLILLPLGCFKGMKVLEDADEVEHSLNLYRRADGKNGFPAGGIKRAITDAIKDLDIETRGTVMSGMHVVGEEETNMAVLSGEHHGESFDFDFKNPDRVVRIQLPVLDEWECTFRVQYVGKIISRKGVEEFISRAGRSVGIGHHRQGTGTFEVKKIVSVSCSEHN